jgi:hypothetical protein
MENNEQVKSFEKTYLILGNKNRYDVNGLEENFTSSDRFENVKEYAKGIIEALLKNEEMINDKQSWEEFCRNFPDYLREESKIKLSMWHDFQKVSRGFKELYLERLIKRKELLERLEREWDVRGRFLPPEEIMEKIIETLTYPLNKKIGILAMEVAKRNKDITLLFYYDPRLSLARSIIRRNSDDFDKIEEVRNLLDDPKQSLLEQELSYTEMSPYVDRGKKEICAIYTIT